MRVTPRMVSLAIMGAVGLIAVLNLFTDFEYVRQPERLAVSSEAEWAAALAIMTALVLVYLSILRILASMYGGGGRRA